MARAREIAVTMRLDANPAFETLDELKARFAKFEKDINNSGSVFAKVFREMGKAAEGLGKSMGIDDTIKKAERATVIGAKTIVNTVKGAEMEMSEARRKAYADVEQQQRELTFAQADEITKRVLLETEGEIQKAKGFWSSEKEYEIVQQAAKAATKERLDAEITLEKAKQAKSSIIYAEDLDIKIRTEEEMLKAHEKRLSDEAASDSKIANKQKQVATLVRAPEKSLGFSQRSTEITENFSAMGAGIEARQLGSVGSTAGGMMGGALGALKGGAVGTIAEAALKIGKVIWDIGEAAYKTKEKVEILANTLHVDAKSPMIEKMTTELFAVQRPIGETRESILSLAKSVSNFTSPDNIADTASAIMRLKAIVGETGDPLDILSTSVGSLVQATGVDGVQATESLARALRELEPQGIKTEEAAKGIARTFTAVSPHVKSSTKAISEAESTFSYFAKSGMKIQAATAAIESTFEGLGKAVKDPAMLDAISKKLPEGVTLANAGLEEGNISAVKFISTMQKMGGTGQEISNMFGVEMGSNMAIAQAQYEKTGITIRTLTGTMRDILAEEESSGKALSAMKAQRFDDMVQSLGEKFVDLVGGVKSVGGSFIQAVPEINRFFTDGLGKGVPVIGKILDLFVDWQIEATRTGKILEESFGSLETFNVLNDALQGKSDSPEFFLELERLMPSITEASGEAASEIEKIKANVEMTDESKMEKIKQILDEIQGMKSAKVFDDIVTASADAETALSKLAEDQYSTIAGIASTTVKSIIDVLTLGMGELFGFSEAIGDLAGDAINQNRADSAAAANERLEQAKAEYAEISARSQAEGGLDEERRASASKLSEARSEQKTTAQELDSYEAKSITNIQQRIDAVMKGAALDGETITRLEAQATIEREIRDTIESKDQNADNIISKLTEQNTLANDSLTFAEAENTAKAQGIELTAEQINLASEQQNALDDYINSEMESNALGEDKIAIERAQIQAHIAKNNAIITALKAQLASINAAIAAQKVSIDAENKRALAAKETAKQQAEIAQIIAGTKKESTNVVQMVQTGNLQAAADATAKDIANLEKSNAGLEKKLSSVGSKKGGSGGGKRRDERGEREEKIPEKKEDTLEKDLQKIEQERIKNLEKNEEEYEKLQEKKRNDEMKAAYDLEGARIARMDAERKFAETILTMVKEWTGKFKDQTDKSLASANSRLSEISTVAEKIAEGAKSIESASLLTTADLQKAQKANKKIVEDFGINTDDVAKSTGTVKTFMVDLSEILSMKNIKEKDRAVKIPDVPALVNDITKELALAQGAKDKAGGTLKAAPETVKESILKLANAQFEKSIEQSQNTIKNLNEKLINALSRYEEKTKIRENMANNAKEQAAKDEKANKEKPKVKSKKGETTKDLPKVDYMSAAQSQVGAQSDALLFGIDDKATIEKRYKGEIGVAETSLKKLQTQAAGSGKIVDDLVTKVMAAQKGAVEAASLVEASKDQKILKAQQLASYASGIDVMSLNVKELTLALSEQGKTIDTVIQENDPRKVVDLLKDTEKSIGNVDWKGVEKQFGDTMKGVGATELRKSAEDTIKEYGKAKESETVTAEQESEKGKAESQIKLLDLLKSKVEDLAKARESLMKKLGTDFEDLSKNLKILEGTGAALANIKNIQTGMSDEKNKELTNVERLQASHLRQRLEIEKQIEALKEVQKLKKSITEEDTKRLGILESQGILTSSEKEEIKALREKAEIDRKRAGELKGLTGGLGIAETDFNLKLPKAQKEDMLASIGELTAAADKLENAFQFAMSLPDKISNIGKAIKSDNAGTAMKGAGEITQEIGKALLKGPGQLPIVGAIMLLGGKITSIMGTISEMITPHNKSDLEIAEDLLKTEELLMAQFQEQADMLDKQEYATKKHLDILIQQSAELAKQDALYAGMVKKGKERLNDDIAKLKIEKLAKEARLSEVEDGKTASHKRQTESLKEELAIIDAKLTAGEQAVSFLEKELELTKAISDAEKERLDARESLTIFRKLWWEAGQIAAKAYNEQTSESKKILMDGLGVSTSQLGNSLSIANTIMNLSAEDWKKLTEEQRSSLQEWVAAWEEGGKRIYEARKQSADIATAYEMALLEKEIAEKELLGEEHSELDKKLKDAQIKGARDKIEINLAEIAQLEKLGGHEDDIIKLKTENLELEMEILRAKKEQNDEAKLSQEKLTKLVQTYQTMLRMERGGLIDSTQRKATEDSIRLELKAQGKTEEEIEKFIATLPKFQAGGFVPKTTLATVHAEEYILPKGIVKKVGVPFLERMRAGENPLSLFRSLEAKIFSEGIEKKNQALITNGGANTIQITININGAQNIDSIMEGIKREIIPIINKTVNRGARTGEIKGTR